MRVAVGVGAVTVLAVFVTIAASLPDERVASSFSQSTAAAGATSRIVGSAQAFLKTLDEAGRARVQFPFDGAQKNRWSNLPSRIFKRNGARLGDLTPPQRTAAMTLLETALSEPGYRKIIDIIRADDVLRGAVPSAGMPPGRMQVAFGADEYFLALFGAPSATTPWMLQLGGHHLAINLTFAGSRATLAPSHTGAQPASYTFEGRAIRPLGNERDRAFALMGSLDPNQQKQAVLGYTVSDLVLGPGQDGRTIQPEGLRAAAMSMSQQTMLIELVREWAGIANDALALPRMDEIRANLPQTYFAWSGPTTDGSAAYFRIQGPTLVIEYAPQRGVDHIHTIYRDPTNDYGAGFVRR